MKSRAELKGRASEANINDQVSNEGRRLTTHSSGLAMSELLILLVDCPPLNSGVRFV
jgi:hypothetical protein